MSELHSETSCPRTKRGRNRQMRQVWRADQRDRSADRHREEARKTHHTEHPFNIYDGESVLEHPNRHSMKRPKAPEPSGASSNGQNEGSRTFESIIHDRCRGLRALLPVIERGNEGLQTLTLIIKRKNKGSQTFRSLIPIGFQG